MIIIQNANSALLTIASRRAPQGAGSARVWVQVCTVRPYYASPQLLKECIDVESGTQNTLGFLLRRLQRPSVTFRFQHNQDTGSCSQEEEQKGRTCIQANSHFIIWTLTQCFFYQYFIWWDSLTLNLKWVAPSFLNIGGSHWPYTWGWAFCNSGTFHDFL